MSVLRLNAQSCGRVLGLVVAMALLAAACGSSESSRTDTARLPATAANSPTVESVGSTVQPAVAPPSVAPEKCVRTVDGADSSVFRVIKGRAGMVSRSWIATDIRQMHPMTEFVVMGPDDEEIAVFGPDLLALGCVTKVEPGKSTRWDDDDVNDRVIKVDLPYNDPTAMVSTVVVTMRVDWSAARPDSEWADGVGTVRFGLVGPSRPVDVDAVRAELMGLGRVIVALGQPGVVYGDYEPAVMSVLLDGQMFGTVGDDGELSFPGTEFNIVPDGVDLSTLQDPSIAEWSLPTDRSA